MTFTMFLAGLLLYALWPLYVFAMAMARAHGEKRVTKFAWALAIPVVLSAITLDIILNYTLLALLTWDFPRKGEWTFSQRLSRLNRQDGVRAKVCRWLTETLLNPYDPDPRGHVK